MSIPRERLVVVLLGLLAGCEKDAEKISPEPASSASQAAEAASGNAAKAAPKPAATVGATEVTPKASGSAKAGSCAPGGCAPGKCG
jgi:hypothetical protein